MASGSKRPIHLVKLPKTAEDNLSAALGVPRVNMLGLLDGAPGAEALLNLMTREVGEVTVPWYEDAIAAVYLPVNIRATETTAPSQPKRIKPNANERQQT